MFLRDLIICIWIWIIINHVNLAWHVWANTCLGREVDIDYLLVF